MRSTISETAAGVRVRGFRLLTEVISKCRVRAKLVHIGLESYPSLFMGVATDNGGGYDVIVLFSSRSLPRLARRCLR